MWLKRLDRQWGRIRRRVKQYELVWYGHWLLLEQIVMTGSARIYSVIEQQADPLVLGDQRVHMDPPRWFGRRKTDWSRRQGIFSFNGLMSLIMAVPIMFYRTENFETLTVVFRWLFTALVVFGIGAIVARRDGLDRSTAQVCLGTLTGGWLWLITLTKMFDPSRLNDWTVWAVAFGLAAGIALMLVSGLTLLVCIVMAYLPRSSNKEIA